VLVNGEASDLADGSTVADVVRALVDDPRGIAVALDRTVVPRSRWSETLLVDGARVEVLSAAAGG
jgi:sulfur carrier protein